MEKCGDRLQRASAWIAFRGLPICVLLLSLSFARAEGLRVAIYAEQAADGEALPALARTVALGGHLPLTVTDEDLAAGLLTSAHFDVFILPEGQDGGIGLYRAHLGAGALDAAIKDFVAAGGGFLGFGAGARYAAASERWDGVVTEGLGLWEGQAVGPLYAQGDGLGLLAIEAGWEAGFSGGEERVVWTGLGAAYFSGAFGTVLATYRTGRATDIEQAQPAIVRFAYGGGRGVLVGPLPYLDPRSTGDWVIWDDLDAWSHDGEHDQGLVTALLEWSAGGEDLEPPSLLPEEPSGRPVALYTTRRPTSTGENGGAYPALLTAVGRALEYAGHLPLAIRDREILDGRTLSRTRFDTLLMPGGYASGYWEQLLGHEQTIRAFVSEGGGCYFGISAGAFYAADLVDWEGETFDYPLDLYPGRLIGPMQDLVPWPEHQLSPIEIIDPLIGGGRYQTWYQGEGHYERPLPGGLNLVEVARYDHAGNEQGTVAIVRHAVGAGRASYPNLHLEVEEGSSRDWMFTGDFDASGPTPDPESEWDLFAALLDQCAPLDPAPSPAPRESLALPTRFGSQDAGWERISEAQDDDAAEPFSDAIVFGDGRLSVAPLSTMHLAGFGHKARLAVPSATLEIEYHTPGTYAGTASLEFSLDAGANWLDTGITPLPGAVDRLEMVDLSALGLDTLEELAAFELRFVHDDPDSAGATIAFDRVWLRLADDRDADGAPDAFDCRADDAGAFALPLESHLSWQGTTRLVWDEQSKLAGEGTLFDYAEGLVSTLRADRGFAQSTCSIIRRSEVLVDTLPPRGDASYHLIRARNACDSGSWGNGRSPDLCP